MPHSHFLQYASTSYCNAGLPDSLHKTGTPILRLLSRFPVFFNLRSYFNQAIRRQNFGTESRRCGESEAHPEKDHRANAESKNFELKASL